MNGEKCPDCKRVTATHAEGCSHVKCPNRHAQMWGGPDGLQGFPGLLAEDRIILRRRSERESAIPVELADL